MIRKLFIAFFIIQSVTATCNEQIRVRLFAGRITESVIFTVTAGEYELSTTEGIPIIVSKGSPVIISRFDGRIAVKSFASSGMICDTVFLTSRSDDGTFSLRINGNNTVRQYYSGNLSCYPDMGTLFLINNCNTEQYIAGVVRTEGGTGQHPEYYKTQAVIARTYMYKYFEKHISDGYNLCDNIHCQAYNGISTEPLIIAGAKATSNLVILDRNSYLIFSAFHSNCGGETSTAEDVWLINHPYLKKVTDPYCINSRNSKWRKSYPSAVWTDYLTGSGLPSKPVNLSSFNFSQFIRLKEYRAGSFTYPLQLMRSDLNLRSSFFSVVTDGDSVILDGRGYGHGVGLCQEGAMVMAVKGFDFRQIIDFYYSDVVITDIINTR